jgi:hypothetical protein
LIDEGIEDLPVIEEQNGEFVDTRRGVKPYGGGSPADWSWGCNGSPYRTEGMCDDWRVGCRWHITVDGIVLSREDTSLAALQGFMPNYFQTATFDGVPNDGIMGTPTLEQFEEEGGARITFTSQVAKYTGWDVQFAYEGVPEWNASIVFPAQLETWIIHWIRIFHHHIRTRCRRRLFQKRSCSAAFIIARRYTPANSMRCPGKASLGDQFLASATSRSTTRSMTR